jgi:uncharacterized protein YjbI with pentapeptide repeats
VPNAIDPYDVPALERALNDSAVRVSTLWIGYISFWLYLIIAAGTVSHRQLFFAGPIKLPFMDIDLSLVGFFLVAPILFVIFHWYVLIQVLLLARTAAAYNDALKHAVPVESDRNRIRQRLANTLLAQSFAGSSDEREGVLGAMLRLMIQLTLVIAPVLLLFIFELRFLPYHSALVTWTHRVLIGTDILILILLWPCIRDGQLSLEWRGIFRTRFGISMAVVAILMASGVLSFPGEFHSNWTRYTNRRIDLGIDLGIAVPSECRPRHILSFILPSNFDRLGLSGELLVDDEIVAKLERAGKAKKQQPHEGTRAGVFRGRDLQCGLLANVDLRRVDLTSSNLTGAQLSGADLGGAVLDGASLQRAYLVGTNLLGASLKSAHLEHAFLFNAQLQGASLRDAELQGADLGYAQLQGASLYMSGLQNSSITNASLLGVGLEYAQLQGADLSHSDLRGAVLDFAELQGASLERANLQGASLYKVQLQGADLRTSQLTLAHMSKTAVWRAKPPKCEDAKLLEIRASASVHIGESDDPEPNRQTFGDKSFGATKDGIEAFVQKLRMPSEEKDKVRAVLLSRLAPLGENASSATEEAWLACATKSASPIEYESRLRAHLIDLACQVHKSGRFVADGVIKHWLHPGELMVGGTQNKLSDAFVVDLARDLLKSQCSNAAEYADELNQLIRAPGSL